ncbi:phosphoribosyltransferase [Aliikangiella maris]|uniref:Phosphoribosyltransferase n=2 Tax=Aliikangiella maris TaxID=3162458 RepID=A0ABV2BPU2_9GAMM
MPTDIFVLSNYHSYKGGQNPNFDKSSSMLLDFKQGKYLAIEFWKALVVDKIRAITGEPFYIATVPSSTAGKSHPGFQALIPKLAQRLPIINKDYNLIKRKSTIDKLATGGNRSLSTHMSSLKVPHISVEKAPVILLDDVTTSGNSLKAAITLLSHARYNVIAAVILGKTVD